MPCHLLKTNIGDIEYSSKGKGTPILFLHGGHSNCKEELSHKGFDLNKFQLITPSRPGYGKTPLDNKKTPKKAAELVVELLHHLSIKSVVVYGISAGGPTAIELAATYPDKVSKLILASAVSKKWLDEGVKTYRTAKIIFSPKVEKSVWGLVKFLSNQFPNLIAKSFYSQFSNKRPYKLNKDDATELISSMKHYRSKEGFLNDMNQTVDDETLVKVSCPTLIIHSAQDNSVPLEHAEHAHRLIKNSRIEILQNQWGHLFWIGRDSKKSIEKTIEFIEQ